VPIPIQQQASLQQLLTNLRDTTTAVSAAAWDFNRDLQGAGPETVVARAAYLRERCLAARAALPRATAQLGRRKDAAPVVKTIRQLDRTLSEQCERGFRPAGPGQWPDSLRAWGPFRTREITEAIQRYDVAMEKFASRAHIELEPRARPSQR
jgi:hypothetical protein